MSERNWNQRFAYFITGWSKEHLHLVTWWHIARFISSVCISTVSIAAALWAVTALLDGLSSQRLQTIQAYRQEQRQAEAQQDQAARGIGQECAVPGAPAHFVAECLASAIATYEKGKDASADAEAQIDMAYWAKLTFAATSIGLVFSFVGLIFLLMSLRQTRLAISNDREIGHKQVRAYVAVDFTPLKPQIGEVPKLDFKIKNSGQSPAHNVNHIAGLMFIPHPLVDHQGDLAKVDPSSKLQTHTLASGGEMEATAEGEGPLTPEQFDIMKRGGDHQVYLVIRVFYDDVFGQPHETKVCAYTHITQMPNNRPDMKGLWKIEWALSHVLNAAT